MHFDGPMIAGGHPYELDALLNAEAPSMLLTGIVALDDFTGGIERGSLWAISGLAGIGVSGLALALAANAASDGDVIVCNGHIPSRVLARRLATLAGKERRLRVASWFSLLPEPPDGLGDGTLEQADLVVVDTWDETWHAATWPGTRAELSRRLRWLRHLARDNGTAIVLTSRMPQARSDDVVGWMADAFDDAADVYIAITAMDDARFGGPIGDTRAIVRSRSVGRRAFRLTGGSSPRLTPEP